MKDIKNHIKAKAQLDQVYDYLNNHEIIRKMIARGDISQADILANPIELLDLIEDYEKQNKAKSTPHPYRIVLSRLDGQLEREMGLSKQMSKELEEKAYLKHIVYQNVPSGFFRYQFHHLQEQLQTKTLNAATQQVIQFIKLYPTIKKGIFLGGEQGFIQSHFASALTIALAQKQIDTAFIAFPDYVSALKRLFNQNQQYQQLQDTIKNAPVLVIDDLGSESPTAWTRDEVLSGLLTYRMNQQLPTFITSMYTLSQLQEIYQLGNGHDFRSRSLIERIRNLTKIYEL